MTSDDANAGFERSIQLQYMAAVSAVAEECGISNIPSGRFNVEAFIESFSEFTLAVQGEVARIRIRGRRFNRSLSVQLTANTQTKVGHYVERIREAIGNSDLPTERRKALSEKLDQLMVEYRNLRLSFSRTFPPKCSSQPSTVVRSGVQIYAISQPLS